MAAYALNWEARNLWGFVAEKAEDGAIACMNGSAARGVINGVENGVNYLKPGALNIHWSAKLTAALVVGVTWFFYRSKKSFDETKLMAKKTG
jgi:hypothetical protein